MDLRHSIIKIFAVIILYIIGAMVPFWVLVIISVITAFFLKDFYELISIGIIYDYLFFMPGNSWYTSFFHTIVFGLIIIVTSILAHITTSPKIRL